MRFIIDAVSPIAADPHGRYHRDFPDVTVAANGDLLALVRECGEWAYHATYDYEKPLTFFEAEPVIGLYRSADGGRSFRREQTVFQEFCFDPVILQLSDGRLLAGVIAGDALDTKRRGALRGVFHRHLPELRTVISVRGLRFALSEDGGRTWTAQPPVTYPGFESHYNLRRPIEAPDGTVEIPITSGYPGHSRFAGLVHSFDATGAGDVTVIAKDPHAELHYSAGAGYWREALARLNDGTMLCLITEDLQSGAMQRTVGAGHRDGTRTYEEARLLASYSTDSGFTWSVPQDTGMRGDYPTLSRTADGGFAAIYTVHGKTGARLMCSRSSDGVQWTDTAVLLEEQGVDYNAPASVLLSDGTVYTACIRTDPDKLRSSFGIRWRTE